MTAVWLAGAENPKQHDYLRSEQVERAAFNVAAWVRNYRSRWALEFEPRQWVAWTDTETCPVEDLADAIDAMGCYPTHVIGPPSWSESPAYLPLWNGEGELPRQYIRSGLVVTDRVLTDRDLNRRVLSSRKRDSVLGVVTGKSRGVDRYDFVISSAWWSVQKNGETQVWDGRKMCRYNAYSKSEVRTRHREDIEELGVDADKVLADDTQALTVLAMRSWIALEDSSTVEPIAEAATPALVTTPEDGPESGALATRPDRERHVLPVMGAFMKESTDPLTGDVSSDLVITSKFESLRRCDNCYLADSCPAMRPEASCAYEIPVEIRTKDQLQKTMQAVLEMQTQRVLQARFAEEVQGQELTGEVGREMDRLFGLTAKMQEVLDNRDTLRVSVEARGAGAAAGGGGALSRLFGESVAQAAKALPEPIDPDDIIDVIGQ
jgi:hypothetical protein